MAICVLWFQEVPASMAWAQEADEPEEQGPADESGAVEEAGVAGESSPAVANDAAGTPESPLESCEGIDCSGHGLCDVVDGEELCMCESGYVRDEGAGHTCVEQQGSPRADSPFTLERLLQELQAPTPNERIRAIQELGELGDPAAVDPLAEVARTDPSPEARSLALRAIHQIGTPEALSVAREIAGDETSVLPPHSSADELRTHERRSRRRIVAGSILFPLGSVAIIGGLAAGLTYGGVNMVKGLDS